MLLTHELIIIMQRWKRSYYLENLENLIFIFNSTVIIQGVLMFASLTKHFKHFARNALQLLPSRDTRPPKPKV